MKTILTIHEIEQKANSLEPMIALARDTNTHLNVVVLGALQSVAAAAGPGVAVYYHDKINNELYKDGAKLVSEIEQLLQQEGISGSVTLECRDPGAIQQTILGHSIFADVTIFSNGSVLQSDSFAQAFNGALFDSGRPALVLGKDTYIPSEVRKLAFAWNGSTEAAKALHLSLALLDNIEEIHVMVVDPDNQKTGPNAGDDIASFLARRGISVTVDRLPSSRRDAADVVLEHATDISADMVVMGSYGRSRFTAWLFGSTTGKMLENAQIPVLMAH